MKTKYAIYYVLIALAALSTPASADMLGDVNADGRITTEDSLLALRMSAGSVAPDMGRADVDADSTVNSLDALMILTMAEKTQVCVNAPEVVSGAFDVTIDIHNVNDLNSGQFDLSFDRSVVNVIDVVAGDVVYSFVDADTIRVWLNHPGGVSDSGRITTISFETTGSQGATCVLDISDGHIFDTESNEISAIWNDCEVTVGVPVTVSAPEVVSIASGAFNATIDIEEVLCMNGGQFDLRYDPDVLKVLNVEPGDIDGTEIPIVGVRYFEDDDHDRYRIFFKLGGADGVSGSGYVAKINFELTGSQGDTSVLDLTNGNLASTGGAEIPAVWIDDCVTIGVPVTVNAPLVVSGTFNATIDIENVTDLDGGQFELSFDSDVVNVIDVSAGNIDGMTVPIGCWSFRNADTIMVTFNLPGVRGVSGSGYAAKMRFAIKGSEGDMSALDISHGLLVNNRADRIPAIWNDCEVTIGEYTPVNRVHNINTGEDFSFIQAAIDDPDTSDWHIIEVDDGFYRENVKVTKSLTIRSLNGSANCVIQDAGGDHVVEITRDHVSISGLTLTRPMASAFNRAGIYLDASYCNVSGNTCSNNSIGIHLCGSSNSSISENNCSNNEQAGIHLDGSSNNGISNNNCSNNNRGGIDFCYSNNNRISNNNCSSNERAGIRLYFSRNNRLTGNAMFENGIVICADSPGYYVHEINETNTVNGKPVYYWKNIESGRIPEGAGQVILVNCTGILVENQELNNASVGMGVAFSSNITVRDNTCSDNHDVGIHFFYSGNSSISSNDCQNNWNDGIYLHGLSRSSVSNNTCSNSNSTGVYSGIYDWMFPDSNSDGIHLNDSSNNNISSNTCSNNMNAGIHFSHSSNNSVSSNICSNNHGGIRLYGSDNACVSNNNCSSNHEGICLGDSGNSRLTGNIMSENGIVIRSGSPGGYTHDIDETNTVNGKPVYYWKDVNGKSIPDGAGQVILAGCEGVLVENQELNNASVGVEVAFSSNVTVRDNTCSNNHDMGVHFFYSNNNNVSSNNCSNNRGGICLYGSSNSISSNNCSNNQDGICLSGSSNNISNNDCTNNEWTGIHLDGSNNSISGNDCSKNHGDGICLSGSGNSVSGNDCSKNHGDGIRLYGSETACISDNDCSTNRRAGIRLYRSNDNSILSNTCSNNRDGILIFFNDSYSNVIYLNNFINNSNNIATQSSSATNIWSSQSKIEYTYRGKTFTNYLGNYCSDYDGGDADGDGIGDVPYDIDPDCPDRDDYPLMGLFETYAPEPIYVPDTYPTMQQAVDNAYERALIIVRDGTYTENVRVDKHLTIRSENGSEKTIVITENSDEHLFEVTADHTTINGFTVKGAKGHAKAGIYLSADHCTISENNASDCFVGIFLHFADGNTITGNHATGNDKGGIYLNASCENKLTKNILSKNGHGIGLVISNENLIEENSIRSSQKCGIRIDGSASNSVLDLHPCNHSSNNAILNNTCEALCGFYLYDAPNNTISGNRIESVYDCISLICSPNSTIADNTMIGRGLSISMWFDDIYDDTEACGNVLNGEPLVFLKGVRNEVINRAAQVFLVDCTNVTVRSINFNDVVVGTYLRNSSRCIVEDNVCEMCSYGICLDDSSGNLVQENTCNNGTQSRYTSFMDGGDGIHLDNSADNNAIVNNTCCRNDDEGIDIWCSSNNTITRNRICGNMDGGVDLIASGGNIIYLNDFVDNAESSCIIGSSLWSSPAEINYTYDDRIFTNYLGNYWDDYSGSDPDNDGIGESPYYIDSDRDNCPLMMPIENYAVGTGNTGEQKEM